MVKMKLLTIAGVVLGSLIIMWILLSWANVLLHELDGNPATWNCFDILVRVYHSYMI